MKIPVILDTDLGTDIDDAWALSFLLRRAELDLRLIPLATGETPRRGVTVTPLDSCGGLELEGNRLERLSRSNRPLNRELGRRYPAWLHNKKFDGVHPVGERGIPFSCTSILFDTVAVHLAYSPKYLQMEHCRLTIDGDGFMHRTATGGVPAAVAVGWSDRAGFQRELVRTIAGDEEREAGSCQS